MYYQNEPGIYVYKYNRVVIHGDNYYENIVTVDYYKSMEVFLSHFWKEEQITRYASTNINDRFCDEVIGKKRQGRWYRSYKDVICNKVNCTEHDGAKHPCFVVYDHNGKLFTPDHLLGLYRKQRSGRRYYVSTGRKCRHYRMWRHMRTFQERKWAHAWDDEE